MTSPPSSANHQRQVQLSDRFAVATSKITELQNKIEEYGRERVDIVMEFRGMGYRNFEIAEILMVSPQRISQIVGVRRRELMARGEE